MCIIQSRRPHLFDRWWCTIRLRHLLLLSLLIVAEKYKGTVRDGNGKWMSLFSVVVAFDITAKVTLPYHHPNHRVTRCLCWCQYLCLELYTRILVTMRFKALCFILYVRGKKCTVHTLFVLIWYQWFLCHSFLWSFFTNTFGLFTLHRFIIGILRGFTACVVALSAEAIVIVVTWNWIKMRWSDGKSVT